MREKVQAKRIHIGTSMHDVSMYASNGADVRAGQEGRGRARRCRDVKRTRAVQARANQGKVGNGGRRILREWQGRTGQSRQSRAGRDAARAGSRAFL